MLSNFLKEVVGELSPQLSGKANVSPDKLGEVGNVVSETIKNGLLNKFQSGGISDIVGLLGQSGSSSSFASSLIQQTVSGLMSKVGLSEGMSSSVAKIAIPFVINKLSQYISSKGKDTESEVTDLLGDLAGNSISNTILSGLSKNFKF